MLHIGQNQRYLLRHSVQLLHDGGRSTFVFYPRNPCYCSVNLHCQSNVGKKKVCGAEKIVN